jgi:hypothetical protein
MFPVLCVPSAASAITYVFISAYTLPRVFATDTSKLADKNTQAILPSGLTSAPSNRARYIVTKIHSSLKLKNGRT